MKSGERLQRSKSARFRTLSCAGVASAFDPEAADRSLTLCSNYPLAAMPGFTAATAVEYAPQSQIVAEVLVVMLGASSHEQDIA